MTGYPTLLFKVAVRDPVEPKWIEFENVMMIRYQDQWDGMGDSG
jgi:hypothetical protein